MEAKELRIGNWVNHLDNWSYRQPKKDFKEFYFKWDESDFYALGECTLNLEDVQPIPLTEEILLKCGFYKDEIKRQSKQHSAYYSIEFLDYKYSFAYAEFRKNWGFYHSYIDAPNEEDNNKFDFISCGIKYLHQLQNLYFALTDEELIVNL